MAFPYNVLEIDCKDELTLDLEVISKTAPVIFDQEAAPLYCDAQDIDNLTQLADRAMCNLVTEKKMSELPTETVLFKPITDNTLLPSKGSEHAPGTFIFSD